MLSGLNCGSRFLSRRRRDLARHRRLARQLVDGIEIQVLLPGRVRGDDEPLAVGADRLVRHVEAGRHETESAANIGEDDLHRLLRLDLFGFLVLNVLLVLLLVLGSLRDVRRSGGHGGRRRGGPPRRLLEQIAELILAELRRAEDQVNARDLAALGPLARREREERPVRAPVDCVGVHVADERHLPCLAAFHRRNPRVRQHAAGCGEVRGPLIVGRELNRTARIERAAKRAGGQQSIAFRVHVDHAQLAAVAEECERFPVGRERRRVIGNHALREPGLGLRGEIVEKQLRHAVAVRRVRCPKAVRRPHDLRLVSRRRRHARCVATVLGRGREDFAADDEQHLLAVRRERQLRDLVRQSQVLDGRRRRRADAPDLHFRRLARRGIHRPDAEVALEGDRPSVARDRRPEHAPVLERGHALRRGVCRPRPRNADLPDVLRTVAVGHEVQELAVATPHRPQCLAAAIDHPAVRVRVDWDGAQPVGSVEHLLRSLPVTDDPDLGLVEMAVSSPPPLRRRVPACADSDAIVGSGRSEELARVALVAEEHRRPARRAHAEHVVHAGDVAAVAREVDPLGVGRPPVDQLRGVVPSESGDVARVDGQDVDVAPTGASRGEGEAPPVRRPLRTAFGRRVRDEQARVTAGGGDGPDVTARDKCDFTSVRRDRRLRKRGQAGRWIGRPLLSMEDGRQQGERANGAGRGAKKHR